jgi:NAD+ kinase
MKVALYTRSFNHKQIQLYRPFLNNLISNNIDIVFSAAFHQGEGSIPEIEKYSFYGDHTTLLAAKPDYFITIGGDGTFLDSLLFIKNSDIPVLGINAGNLGFLANNPQETIDQCIQNLIHKNYHIEKRSVLTVKSNKNIFSGTNFALNDFTIHKRDNSSLTKIATYLNDTYFSTFWSDGIIVSTPTGSTAYSLSCGGPIIWPDSRVFIIVPVAPHNLNVRPIVISDDVEVSFEVDAREGIYLVSLDSRYEIVDKSYKISVKKAPFELSTIRFKDRGFSHVIREKLMWAVDNRNI